MPTTWAEVAAHLRRNGWTVRKRPLGWGDYPPYEWRSPDGCSGNTWRSHDPDSPPEEVMRDAHRSGLVDFLLLQPVGRTS